MRWPCRCLADTVFTLPGAMPVVVVPLLLRPAERGMSFLGFGGLTFFKGQLFWWPHTPFMVPKPAPQSGQAKVCGGCGLSAVGAMAVAAGAAGAAGAAATVPSLRLFLVVLGAAGAATPTPLCCDVAHLA